MPIILWESWSTAGLGALASGTALAALARPGVAVPAGRADGKVAGRSDIPEENMLYCGIPPAPVGVPLTPAAPGAPRDPNDWNPGTVDGKPRSPPTTGQAAQGTRGSRINNAVQELKRLARQWHAAGEHGRGPTGHHQTAGSRQQA